MEFLEPARRESGLLREMEKLLRERAWDRPTEQNSQWPYLLGKRLRIEVPVWVYEGAQACYTHGDCTVSNAMRRESGRLVIADPYPSPPHVGKLQEADMGRLLQSALGWECAAYDEEQVEWEPPAFWSYSWVRRRAIWWCGVTALRILADTSARTSDRGRAWCDWAARQCFGEVERMSAARGETE